MEIFKEDLFSKTEVSRAMDNMNSFGIRLTGSKGQSDFVDYLKSEIKKTGLSVVEKEYAFDRWQSDSASLTVDGEQIKISSVFPYSGLTPDEGVTGRLVKVKNSAVGFKRARGKIGVVEIKNLRRISSKVAFDKRRSYPENLEIEKSYRGPVSTAFVKTLLTFGSLKHSGAKAIICIWRDMSDEMVEGQYLNFIMDYLSVPVVWVNSTEGDKVLKAAAEKKSATVTVKGSIERGAKTSSFYTVIGGTENTKEAVIVNTHTDGLNFCEENGAVGMLSMIKYFKAHPTKRNLIFAFVTGHFRLPKFRTGFDQATSRFLADFKSLWSGKTYKAVAGCSVEHLGCTEYKDIDGKYQKTNDVDVELVYTGNKKVDKIYYEALEGRKVCRTMTLRGHNFMHFGEGQPLFNKKIPEIALVTAPDYLCSVDANHHMDKFNLDLMCEQIETFVRCVLLLDEKSAKQIGKAQGYSLGLGRLK